MHVTHKKAYPFSKWNIEELGSENGLSLVGESVFWRSEYRGYINKRGSGANCNQTFPVGLASTFKFAAVSAVWLVFVFGLMLTRNDIILFSNFLVFNRVCTFGFHRKFKLILQDGGCLEIVSYNLKNRSP